MITVKIRTNNGAYRIVSDGHADHNPGNDTVCAGVSAILYTLIGSLENQVETGKKRHKVEPGSFDIRYSPGSPQDTAAAAIIFNTAIIGLAQMAKSYPAHVRLTR